ncbi:MAG: hypothetical protein ACFE0Q_20860 [Anaerolineae bacterium]
MMMLSLSPIMAQETTPDPQPTQEITPAPPDTTEPGITDTWLDETLLIGASLALIIVVGGSFVLALRALDALKISVPQETTDHIAQQIVTTMRETMDAIGKQVQSTPSPIDDAIYSAGRIPIEALINELANRSLSPDQSVKAYQALNRSLDELDGIDDTDPLHAT